MTMPVEIVTSPMVNFSTLLCDAVSLVWVELVMFALAVVVYFAFHGPTVNSNLKKKSAPPSDDEEEVTPKAAPRKPASPRAAAVMKRADALKPTDKSANLDITKQMALIRACSNHHDLEGAMSVFQKITASGVQLNSLVCNCLLDACVQCGRPQAALDHFTEMKELGLADVVSYNTLMKSFLKAGQVDKARKLVTEMIEAGVPPNKVTYNELLNALVMAKDRRGMWALVQEMSKRGMQPNSVTCSIILKSLTAYSDSRDMQRAMDLVECMQGEMDEVLFSSMIEACVRAGRLDMLSGQLQKYASSGGFEGLTAPTYGSMIKAYGKARDVERVWTLWNEMRKRSVKPTSITLGCMVDALVKNGQAEEAFDLVQEIKGEACSGILNTVIYSTLLKGFTMARNPDRVQQVYLEMREQGIACNTITYNTMIDVNCRTGRMDRAEELFEDMKTFRVDPDVVTYSTFVKGYCLSGNIEKGFTVLRDMVATGKHEPDEILYNSLLDGCAKQHRVDEALDLLKDMQAQKVQPSNYTLSILVKLLGRSRRLNQAFTMVEEVCQRCDFQANIHVYTCLLQACIQNRQLARALQLHDSMITEAGVQPDAKTYAVLARGCLSSGSFEKASSVVRVAYGLSSSLRKPEHAPGVEPRALEEVMSALSGSPMAERLAVPLLADLKAMGVHVEGGVYQQAVKTSVNRAGRGNVHPVRSTFNNCRW